MYHIKKHKDGRIIHNDDNGSSPILTWQEMVIVLMELPELACELVSAVYADEIL